MNANQNNQTEPSVQDSRPFVSIRGSTSEPVRLSMREIVRRGSAIEAAAGRRVFDQIAQAFRNEQRVELSFANVELTLAAFLNVAIGQLYGEFTEEEIREHIGRGPSTRPEETIRIAFAWDKDQKKVVIGYIGQHQKNTKS